MPERVKSKRRKFLIPFIIIFSFVLPLVFLILGLVIFKTSNKFVQTLKEEEIKAEERLTPSQVLKSKSKYHQQKIWLRGRVELSPIVCEKKECPAEDSCCGCPEERDLYLYDAGTILKTAGQEKLKMRDIFTSQALCQRKIGNCDYDCGDWDKGAVYDVYGRFFAEQAPPGWQMSLNYYFEVENKELVKKINFSEKFGNFINEIKEKLQNWRGSGQYVLP
jgi:hypothetical protein